MVIWARTFRRVYGIKIGLPAQKQEDEDDDIVDADPYAESDDEVTDEWQAVDPCWPATGTPVAGISLACDQVHLLKNKSPLTQRTFIKLPSGWGRKSGAGEGARTLDPDLGKVVLYH